MCNRAERHAGSTALEPGTFPATVCETLRATAERDQIPDAVIFWNAEATMELFAWTTERGMSRLLIRWEESQTPAGRGPK